MKLLINYFLVLLFITSFIACRDESLSPEPTPLSAVHGYLNDKASDNDDVGQHFYVDQPEKVLSWRYLWNSIDNLNTVVKVEFFVEFTEAYLDFNGDELVANHGKKLLRTLEAGGLGANRDEVSFSLSQSDVYDLFSDSEFAYDITEEDDSKISVFGTTINSMRDIDNSPFTTKDVLKISWIMHTEDGRVFDSWSESLCGEFPGANCNYSITVKESE